MYESDCNIACYSAAARYHEGINQLKMAWGTPFLSGGSQQRSILGQVMSQEGRY